MIDILGFIWYNIVRIIIIVTSLRKVYIIQPVWPVVNFTNKKIAQDTTLVGWNQGSKHFVVCTDLVLSKS